MQDREAYRDTNAGRGELPQTPPFSEEDLRFFDDFEANLAGGYQLNIFLLHVPKIRYAKLLRNRGTEFVAAGEGRDVMHAISRLGQGNLPEGRQGNPNSTNPLDEWILRGNVINVSGTERDFIVALSGQRNGSFKSKSLRGALKKAFESPSA